MYPTKEEILREPRPRFPRGLLSLISRWKKEWYSGWKELSEERRWLALEILAIEISALYGRPLPGVSSGVLSAYEQSHIYLKNTSVISLLHELAHHLFGPDEHTACRWSVWLYQLRFRNDYNKLVWKEHLLVKPKEAKEAKEPKKSSEQTVKQ